MQANFFDPAVYETRRRSAQLMADPKAREMSMFVGSRNHEARLREAAGLGEEDPKTAAHCAKVLAAVQAAEDKEKRFDPMDNCKARLEWREEMDRGIRRLMTDADLMMADSLQERTKHGLRCNHLDKTYDWFERHGKKEASKERPAPAYLRFDLGDAVMPGSLRKSPENGPRGWMPTAKPVLAKGSLGAAPSIMAAAAQSLAATGSVGTAGMGAMVLGPSQAKWVEQQQTAGGYPGGAGGYPGAGTESPTKRLGSACSFKSSGGKWNLPGAA